MKTTIDLPENLVLSLKITAARRGEKVKTLAADTFRAAMSASNPSSRHAAKGKIKLPLFACVTDAPASGMSVEALLALEQETQKQEDLERLSLPV